MFEKPENGLSQRIKKGRALLGGFIPRKTRTLACRLPGVDEAIAAVAVCRTWKGEVNYITDGLAAYLEWPRIRERWLTHDVYHQQAVAEIDRQLNEYGEALFALNEEHDAKPKRLFLMAPHDHARWKVVTAMDFKSASLGEADV